MNRTVRKKPSEKGQEGIRIYDCGWTTMFGLETTNSNHTLVGRFFFSSFTPIPTPPSCIPYCSLLVPSRTMKQPTSTRTFHSSSDDRVRPGNSTCTDTLVSLLMIPTRSQGERFAAPTSLHLDVPQSLGDILGEAQGIIHRVLDLYDLSGCLEETHSVNGPSAASDQDMRQ